VISSESAVDGVIEVEQLGDVPVLLEVDAPPGTAEHEDIIVVFHDNSETVLMVLQ
jgi:hypothetical protein